MVRHYLARNPLTGRLRSLQVFRACMLNTSVRRQQQQGGGWQSEFDPKALYSVRLQAQYILKRMGHHPNLMPYTLFGTSVWCLWFASPMVPHSNLRELMDVSPSTTAAGPLSPPQQQQQPRMSQQHSRSTSVQHQVNLSFAIDNSANAESASSPSLLQFPPLPTTSTSTFAVPPPLQTLSAACPPQKRQQYVFIGGTIPIGPAKRFFKDILSALSFLHADRCAEEDRDSDDEGADGHLSRRLGDEEEAAVTIHGFLSLLVSAEGSCIVTDYTISRLLLVRYDDDDEEKESGGDEKANDDEHGLHPRSRQEGASHEQHQHGQQCSDGRKQSNDNGAESADGDADDHHHHRHPQHYTLTPFSRLFQFSKDYLCGNPCKYMSPEAADAVLFDVWRVLVMPSQKKHHQHAAPAASLSSPFVSSFTTATDIYSLGIIAFEMVTGVHPFEHYLHGNEGDGRRHHPRRSAPSLANTDAIGAAPSSSSSSSAAAAVAAAAVGLPSIESLLSFLSARQIFEETESCEDEAKEKEKEKKEVADGSNNNKNSNHRTVREVLGGGSGGVRFTFPSPTEFVWLHVLTRGRWVEPLTACSCRSKEEVSPPLLSSTSPSPSPLLPSLHTDADDRNQQRPMAMANDNDQHPMPTHALSHALSFYQLPVTIATCVPNLGGHHNK